MMMMMVKVEGRRKGQNTDLSRVVGRGEEPLQVPRTVQWMTRGELMACILGGRARIIIMMMIMTRNVRLLTFYVTVCAVQYSSPW